MSRVRQWHSDVWHVGGWNWLVRLQKRDPEDRPFGPAYAVIVSAIYKRSLRAWSGEIRSVPWRPDGRYPGVPSLVGTIPAPASLRAVHAAARREALPELESIARRQDAHT